MPLLLTILSITTVQLPAVVVRYLPYAKAIGARRRRILFCAYGLCFILQHFVVYLLIKDSYEHLTPLSYKRLLFLLSAFYVLLNILIIRGNVFKHLFIYGMQGGYTIFIHSIVALGVGRFGAGLPLYGQFVTQSVAYVVLFTLLFIPLWRKLRGSIVFNSSITDQYFWNIIWLIPALAIYSDALITMDTSWINSPPQILSRIFTAISIIICWKWITLDFSGMENNLYLKNLNKVFHLQKEGIAAQAHFLKEAEEHIKLCKHDLRHNLGILGALLQKGALQEAQAYLVELDGTMRTTEPIVYCENTIINSVFLVYLTRAKEAEIQVMSQLAIPEALPWSSNDIAILLANALENAIAATSKEAKGKRSLQLTARCQDDKLTIIIKNTFAGQIVFGSNGFPVAQEEDHGLGIQSILSIAKKYQAYASCAYADGWVTMSFLFAKPQFNHQAKG